MQLQVTSLAGGASSGAGAAQRVELPREPSAWRILILSRSIGTMRTATSANMSARNNRLGLWSIVMIPPLRGARREHSAGAAPAEEPAAPPDLFGPRSTKR